MREHKDAAVKTRYIGNISAFLAYPRLGIVSSFLIFIKSLNESFEYRKAFSHVV